MEVFNNAPERTLEIWTGLYPLAETSGCGSTINGGENFDFEGIQDVRRVFSGIREVDSKCSYVSQAPSSSTIWGSR